MKKKILALALAACLGLGLVGCDCDYRGPDVKVKHNGDTTYIYYHNSYRPGNVEIVGNEDGSYTVMVTVLPPDTFTAP